MDSLTSEFSISPILHVPHESTQPICHLFEILCTQKNPLKREPRLGPGFHHPHKFLVGNLLVVVDRKGCKLRTE